MSKWTTDSDELKKDIASGLIVGAFGPEDTDTIDVIGRDW